MNLSRWLLARDENGFFDALITLIFCYFIYLYYTEADWISVILSSFSAGYFWRRLIKP